MGFETSRDQITNIVNAPDYRYFRDDKNGIVEAGISIEQASGVLIEEAIEKLKNFDALVLIHPDYISTKRKTMYKTVMEGVVRQSLDLGRAVFCLPYGDGDSGLEDFVMSEPIPLPDSGGDDSVEKLQSEIDYIAELIGKPPQDISLAFGGMLADLCVAQWRNGWCYAVDPEFNHLARTEVGNPIALGVILPELTAYGF